MLLSLVGVAAPEMLPAPFSSPPSPLLSVMVDVEGEREKVLDSVVVRCVSLSSAARRGQYKPHSRARLGSISPIREIACPGEGSGRPEGSTPRLEECGGIKTTIDILLVNLQDMVGNVVGRADCERAR